MLNEKRVLAYVDIIHHINPIRDADNIECGMIRNWPVVIGKGEFRNGDQVLYIEPDAALPISDPRFASLAGRGTTDIDGVQYHVLKTIRLRGQLSQGIVFPLDKFRELDPERSFLPVSIQHGDLSIDDALGIRLWEPPQSPLGADQKGPWNLPWLRKTDAERIQNLPDIWLESVDDGLWIPTEKIDGTSITFAMDDLGDLHIYSRNWELKTDNPNAMSVKLAHRYDVWNWMMDNDVTAIQGEMYGEGIQSNRLKVSGQHLAVFAVWQHQIGVEPSAHDRFADHIASPLSQENALDFVPTLELPFPKTVEQGLAQADGMRSLINPDQLAEGIVWHHLGDREFPGLDYRRQFKVVSPAFLIRHGL